MTIVPDHESCVPVMVREYDTLCRYKIVLDNESNLLICIMGGVTEEGPAETGVIQGIETDEQTYQSQ